MDSTAITAIGKYLNTQNGTKIDAGIENYGGDKVSFGETLKEYSRDTVDKMRASEDMSAKALTGDASLTDVVTAINSAQTSLETVVAVRDRMIQAYQEIMRMPI